MPANAIRAQAGQGDYQLTVKLVAHDKKGPVYGDMKFGESFVKGVLSLGFAADEYAIIADFDITYVLRHQGKVVFQKGYDVQDEVANEQAQLDFKNGNYKYATRLLRKHVILTLNDFFGLAAERVAPASQA